MRKTKIGKHTQLKRKTGSKLLIDCLNRLKHTISYHEVREKQVEHQLVRAYFPPAVQPSTFLTFVYDNCDHNPETLTGATMHCTIGIIIQRKSVNDQTDEPPTEKNTNPPIKRKSFAHIDVDITPYHLLQQVPPDKINDIERNTNIIKEYLSKKADLLRILLRQQRTYNADNEKQTILGWAGFHHEVTNASEEPIHDIHYLPEVNSLPTKYDTVQ